MQNQTRSNRRNHAKRMLMVAMMLMFMPLTTGCDIAKIMSAITQLVGAIAPSTGTAGTTPQAGGTAAGTPAVPQPAAGAATRAIVFRTPDQTR